MSDQRSQVRRGDRRSSPSPSPGAERDRTGDVVHDVDVLAGTGARH